MKYRIIRNQYDKYMAQVDAIMREDYREFARLAGRHGVPESPYECWANADGDHLFSALPGTCHCLTTLKGVAMGPLESFDGEAGVRHEDQHMFDRLGLANEPLVPRDIPPDWRPTEKQLRVFAGLQLVAQYGEDACRRAGVLEYF